MGYLRNHNAQLRVDGTLHSVPSSMLTYDGVHPTAEGVNLLANQIAQGISEALKQHADADD
jgi:lysophospholipase L1-like esterase